jgi:hypothetical protein
MPWRQRPPGARASALPKGWGRGRARPCRGEALGAAPPAAHVANGTALAKRAGPAGIRRACREPPARPRASGEDTATAAQGGSPGGSCEVPGRLYRCLVAQGPAAAAAQGTVWGLDAKSEAKATAAPQTVWGLDAKSEATAAPRRVWCLDAQSAQDVPGRRRRAGRASLGESGCASTSTRLSWTRTWRVEDVPTVPVLRAGRGVDRNLWIVHGAHRPSSSHRLVGGAACADGRSVGSRVRLLRGA